MWVGRAVQNNVQAEEWVAACGHLAGSRHLFIPRQYACHQLTVGRLTDSNSQPGAVERAWEAQLFLHSTLFFIFSFPSSLVGYLKNRRALFTERAWILQCWIFKPITIRRQRDLLLVPTCPCMLHPVPSVIATQPPSPARLVHHSIQSHYLISTQAAATLLRQLR